MSLASIWIAAFLFAGQLPKEEPGSWLDKTADLNLSLSTVPPVKNEGTNPRCDATLRAAQTPADRVVVGQGWRLSTSTTGKRVNGGTIEVIQALLSYDGMCRPRQFQAFVFLDGRLMGKLSPTLMNSREDGALTRVSISASGNILATFSRYSRTDALCCPSRESHAVYAFVQGNGGLTLKLIRVDTMPKPKPTP
ncbi:MAG TPA: LppP/LprE family lipoprotein [Terriglobia bacterium]|nr:LppP/LprE family lipoprotein [Terriglobia bacterium]